MQRFVSMIGRTNIDCTSLSPSNLLTSIARSARHLQTLLHTYVCQDLDGIRILGVAFVQLVASSERLPFHWHARQQAVGVCKHQYGSAIVQTDQVQSKLPTSNCNEDVICLCFGCIVDLPSSESHHDSWLCAATGLGSWVESFLHLGFCPAQCPCWTTLLLWEPTTAVPETMLS